MSDLPLSGPALEPGGAVPGDVLVVGDLNIDVVTTYRGPIRQASDTPARVRLVGGGSAANTAFWLADLGDRPRLLAAVGDDAFGSSAAADLDAAGVDHLGPVVTGATTGTCVVLVGPDGERTMFPDRGANERLPAQAVVDALGTRPPGWLHLSGYALLGDGSRPAGRAAVAGARRLGCHLSVDAASAAPLRAVGADTFLGWIEGATVLLANDDEIEALGGVGVTLGRVGSVIVKHGAAGATWADGGSTASVPGLPVRVVDTAGAGDAFAAGWIVARRAGADPPTALAAAAAAGARAVTQEGARPRPRDPTRAR